MRFRRVTSTDMKLATAPKTKAGAIDWEITCESCDGGGVSSIHFPHASRAPVLFRAIQRIRIAHNEDQVSSDSRGGRYRAQARQVGRQSGRDQSQARSRAEQHGANEFYRLAARTRSPAEDKWIHLKSMITPSAPSASCSPRRCVFKTMETPLSFFNHSVPAPSSPSAHPARIWAYTPAKSARS